MICHCLVNSNWRAARELTQMARLSAVCDILFDKHFDKLHGRQCHIVLSGDVLILQPEIAYRSPYLRLKVQLRNDDVLQLPEQL